MKIFHKYILSEFLKLFVLTMVLFLTIFLLVEFVDKMDSIMNEKIRAEEAAAYFLYKIPGLVNLITPIAVLMATTLTLGILSRHSEITAIKAGGTSILKITTPILICAVLISFIVILVNEAVVPVTNDRAMAIENKWLNKKPSEFFGDEGIWLKRGSGLYNIKKVDIDNNTIEGITFYSIKDPFNSFKADSKVIAQSAVWVDEGWQAGVARVTHFTEDGAIEESVEIAYVFPELSPPEELDFSGTERGQEDMGYLELKNYIAELKDEGYNTDKVVVDLYGRISFPLVNIIMVLIGIPFALRPGRHGGIADGIAVSVVIAFSFWIVFAVARSLGQSGVLPPIVAAGFPDLLFVAVGVYLFTYVRQ